MSLEEYVAVDDGKVCTAPIMADKGILEFVQSSSNITDADFEDKNEVNNAARVFTSLKIKNIMKKRGRALLLSNLPTPPHPANLHPYLKGTLLTTFSESEEN
ncbi:hypothetical protein TNCV_1814611 [Trichonephila clavipes]|nr:hypothetical protein TNCV_1814611 [Trichonephila clavipes]